MRSLAWGGNITVLFWAIFFCVTNWVDEGGEKTWTLAVWTIEEAIEGGQKGQRDPGDLELITLITNLCVPCGAHQEDEVGIVCFYQQGCLVDSTKMKKYNLHGAKQKPANLLPRGRQGKIVSGPSSFGIFARWNILGFLHHLHKHVSLLFITIGVWEGFFPYTFVFFCWSGNKLPLLYIPCLFSFRIYLLREHGNNLCIFSPVLYCTIAAKFYGCRKH